MRRRSKLRRSSLPPAVQPPQDEPADADIRAVLESGVRDISGEIRNSLDFHRTQDQGGQVSHVALSGAALDLPASPMRCRLARYRGP